MELHKLTAHELLENKANPKDVRVALEERIKKIDNKVKAILRSPHSFGERPPMLCGGRLCPDENQAGKGALSGIPIAIKDNICIENCLITCCSHILQGFKPPYNATVIEKLIDAGCVIIAITNMDEFAFGSSTENSYYGPTHNPWDLERVPGGSSGGSAAAVAADETILALGSDTGGSIRQPASFCGVVGLKPTYGRVSRYGLIAFASSLDQIGPITKDITDAAMLLNVIAGYDPKDSTSVDLSVPDYTKSLGVDIKGIKIAIPKEYFVEGIDKEVKMAIEQAINLLKSRGAVVKEVSLPHTEYAVATYYIVATAEASSNLARFDGVQYGLRILPKNIRRSKLIDMYEETREIGLGAEAKRRIILGTYGLSSGYYEAYYLRALKVRTLIKQDFDKVFAEFDAIITPTSPTPAFKIAEKTTDPLEMYLSDIYTISANLAGIPAISIPCGFTENNLPIGLQILAKPFDEEMLFRIGFTYEQNTEWHKRNPLL
ncbi:MAG: Asp-tRNA(Asn)/Glu-tRNA(Gln) amidotransferase subunit GatA [Candidatus Omnitrophota bacterium]|nr:Asp-tRNA(Asn)/Glu-tRNA(Gln) amidotransferase subunit GatA [Candidatus Omnitrophota bacterium]